MIKLNQLQKDIKTALKWFEHIPYEKRQHGDVKAFERLKWYADKDLGYETYTGENNE